MSDQTVEATADAISSLLQAAPHQKLHLEQIEHNLNKQARPKMREALELLQREETVQMLDNIYFALLP